MSELNNIALKIIGNGKGILAADESTGTMTKRLQGVNIESNSENRLKFRHTLFSSKSMKTCIGGVILYDETIKQKFSSKKISELISETSAVPGIKVDTGVKIMGESNILNKLPISASSLYSKNVFNFVSNLYDKENKKININLEDEIIAKTIIK